MGADLAAAGADLHAGFPGRALADGKDVAKQAGNNHPTSIPTGVFKTSDGYINIATTGGRIWERCAQAIGAPELVTNPDYATAPARSKNRDALNAAIGKLTEKKSTDTWVSELNAAGVPCGPIYSIDQMFEDAQVKHLGIAQYVPNDENRHIQLVGQPVTLSRTPSRMAARRRNSASRPKRCWPSSVSARTRSPISGTRKGSLTERPSARKFSG